MAHNPANLDFEISRQQDDGAWHPVWAWGQYEEVWPQAEQEWAGYLTVNTLKVLHNFKRIEGI